MVERTKMLGRVVGFLATTILVGSAQELDPHDPAVIAGRVSRAGAVVVGTFKVGWCLPWFDGWHCNGAVHVVESLYGPWKATDAIQFRWRERYGNACLACEKVSQFDGDSGIWFLSNSEGTWRFTSTGASWCGGPFAASDRDLVVGLIRQKTGKAIQLE